MVLIAAARMRAMERLIALTEGTKVFEILDRLHDVGIEGHVIYENTLADLYPGMMGDRRATIWVQRDMIHEARQAIVDSWPADVECGAAHRDWGFEPTH